MSDDARCNECRRHLFGDTETEVGICGYCADRSFARYQAKVDFTRWHRPPALDDDGDPGPTAEEMDDWEERRREKLAESLEY